MKIIVALIVFLSVSSVRISYSQENNAGNFKIQELKEKALNIGNKIHNEDSKDVKLDLNSKTSYKSPGVALLLSLVVPGAGHYYINRFDVGKYFFGVDVGSWIGYAALNIYGDNVSDQSKVFSVQHAEIGSTNGKDDDFFTNIGAFDNVYDYNNYQLSVGEYSDLYNVNTNYWNWDETQNQYIYETQRRDSERIYNNRIIFGSILVVNRIVSGISAYLLANKQNKKSTALNVMPELLYKKDYSFDGIKINLSRNF
ncbi:MAG TPA: hypothetical protein PKD83_13595 [Ignavibacteria bacterium]|nr:hypothetical protein [Ignavibacteria bacterium]